MAEHLTGVALLTTARTFFKAVRKLPPGHALTVDCDSVGRGASSPRSPARPERHWRPERAPRARLASDDACAEEFLEVCRRAVEDRLRGPGPVGAHLSGGLDSSGIAALAARALRRRGRPPPPAFSWLPALDGEAPAPAHAKEYALIDAVCAQEGLQVSHCALSPGDVLAVPRRDGAFPGVHAHMNEEAVQRCAAASGVRVLLSGWGGDEGASFNGRGHLQHLLLSGRWRRLTAECRARGMGPRRFLLDCALPLAFPGLMLDYWRLRQGKTLRSRRGVIDPAFRRWLKPRAEPPAPDRGSLSECEVTGGDPSQENRIDADQIVPQFQGGRRRPAGRGPRTPVGDPPVRRAARRRMRRARRLEGGRRQPPHPASVEGGAASAARRAGRATRRRSWARRPSSACSNARACA